MEEDLIKAEMHILPDNPRVLAVGNVTVANFLVIKNVRYMKGKDGNAFISFPGEHGPDGWRSIVSALTPELKEKITEKVFEAVKYDLGKGMGVYAEDVSVKVVPVKNDGQLRGIATLEMFGLKIGGIKILEKKDQKGLYVSMPQYKLQGKNGMEWKDAVYPLSAGARWQIAEWVLDAYEKEIGKNVQKSEVKTESQSQQEYKAKPENESRLEPAQEQATTKNIPAEISDAVSKELENEILGNNVLEQRQEIKEKMESSDERKLNEIQAWIEKHWPLTDENWDYVIQKVSEYTSDAKDDPEIMKKYVEMMDCYNQREKNEEAMKQVKPKEYAPVL